jgi:hypothetical protein
MTLANTLGSGILARDLQEPVVNMIEIVEEYNPINVERAFLDIRLLSDLKTRGEDDQMNKFESPRHS